MINEDVNKPPEEAAVGQLFLIDWENVQLHSRRAELLWSLLDLAGMDLDQDHVWVIGSHGFGPDQQQWLAGLGVQADVLEYIRVPDGLKNGADIAMSVRAVDWLHERGYQRFALAAGDFDFRPLLVYLRGRGVHTTLLHTKPAVSWRLKNAADAVLAVPRLQSNKRLYGARRGWRDIDFHVERVVPLEQGLALEALETLGRLVDGQNVRSSDLAGILATAGVLPHAAINAFQNAGELSPRGALLGVDPQSGRVWRMTMKRTDWVEEAYVVWTAAGLAAITGKSLGQQFRNSVYVQAVQRGQGSSALGTAWGRVQVLASLPPFVGDAQKRGMHAPADASIRREVLSHLRGRGIAAAGPSVTVGELNATLSGVAVRLGKSDITTLLAALKKVSVTDGQDWQEHVDAGWICAVLAAVHPALKASARDRYADHYLAAANQQSRDAIAHIIQNSLAIL